MRTKVLIALLACVALVGCEEDSGKNVPDAENMPPGSLVVEGDAERSAVETVRGTAYVGGNLVDSKVDTAPMPEEDDDE